MCSFSCIAPICEFFLSHKFRVASMLPTPSLGDISSFHSGSWVLIVQITSLSIVDRCVFTKNKGWYSSLTSLWTRNSKYVLPMWQNICKFHSRWVLRTADSYFSPQDDKTFVIHLSRLCNLVSKIKSRRKLTKTYLYAYLHLF
jgi:hypothetical protein